MKFTFKPFRGDKSRSDDGPEITQNPGQKRREQVRRAQKTHRERKEAYTASLESEVIQLRANEARILQETRTLYSEIGLLKRTLLENGIAVPEGDDRIEEKGESSSGGVLTLTVGQEDKKKNRRKQIYVQQRNAETSKAQLTTPPLSNSTVSPTLSQPSTRLGSLDPEFLGMDFVLTLESPCLPHIDASRPSSSSDVFPSPSPGHALTVSACLFHTHPSPPGQRQSSPDAWRIPQASIAQLLSLSHSIPLQDGEVTPVQAWDYVRRQEGFGGLDVAGWETLKGRLVGFVRCYGFGGVIERVVFENVVFEAFVVGRVF